MEPTTSGEPAGRLGQQASTAGMYAELVIYLVVSVALVVGAAALLVDAIASYVTHLGDDVLTASVELLSILLLVFVFVELLGATRVTIREQRLVAEPFLLVGIIASIKEIVLVAGAERPKDEEFEAFRNGMIEVGVLAGIVLVLSISTLLLRRKEREPGEGAKENDG
ncbi:MAG TPA: phosphate-starvation-inducible PsiE family protein [Microthrixaceae bacterium]|nr:phosphate-starvation-inducible PsiE family protein [Microthrixaceae bacterium]